MRGPHLISRFGSIRSITVDSLEFMSDTNAATALRKNVGAIAARENLSQLLCVRNEIKHSVVLLLAGISYVTVTARSV